MVATIEGWRGGVLCRVYERVDGATVPLIAVAGSATFVRETLQALLGVTFQNLAELSNEPGLFGGDEHGPESSQRVIHANP